MKAAQVMTTDVVTVRDSDTVRHAAESMLKHQVSALPVVDGKGRLVGIVSEGDLMRRAEIGTERHRSWWLEMFTGNRELATDYIKAHSQKVADVMTARLVTAKPDTPLDEIAAMLETNAIKRVPVVDRGRLVGIVSRANLLHALARMTKEARSRAKVKDETIRKELLETMRNAPWRPWLFNVTVQDGIVDVWGIVETAAEKKAASVAAEEVRGVKKVRNNLLVRPKNWAQAARHFSRISPR